MYFLILNFPALLLLSTFLIIRIGIEEDSYNHFLSYQKYLKGNSLLFSLFVNVAGTGASNDFHSILKRKV